MTATTLLVVPRSIPMMIDLVDIVMGFLFVEDGSCVGEGALCPRHVDKATRVPVRGAPIRGAMVRFPVPFGVAAGGICRSGSTRCGCGAQARFHGDFHAVVPRWGIPSRIGNPNDIRTRSIHALLVRPDATRSP